MRWSPSPTPTAPAPAAARPPLHAGWRATRLLPIRWSRACVTWPRQRLSRAARSASQHVIQPSRIDSGQAVDFVEDGIRTHACADSRLQRCGGMDCVPTAEGVEERGSINRDRRPRSSLCRVRLAPTSERRLREPLLCRNPHPAQGRVPAPAAPSARHRVEPRHH